MRVRNIRRRVLAPTKIAWATSYVLRPGILPSSPPSPLYEGVEEDGRHTGGNLIDRPPGTERRGVSLVVTAVGVLSARRVLSARGGCTKCRWVY